MTRCFLYWIDARVYLLIYQKSLCKAIFTNHGNISSRHRTHKWSTSITKVSEHLTIFAQFMTDPFTAGCCWYQHSTRTEQSGVTAPPSKLVTWILMSEYNVQNVCILPKTITCCLSRHTNVQVWWSTENEGWNGTEPTAHLHLYVYALSHKHRVSLNLAWFLKLLLLISANNLGYVNLDWNITRVYAYRYVMVYVGNPTWRAVPFIFKWQGCALQCITVTSHERHDISDNRQLVCLFNSVITLKQR